ncbi:MAG: type IV pilus modification protein PilV [Dokdonella sp.]
MAFIFAKQPKSAIQAGATLIEVLVTVAVTSIGLLGMAGLMAVSAKINHRAYLDTQAGFIAQALIESMHINAAAVAEGRYDGAFTQDALHVSACATRGCSPTERAAYDRMRFARALRYILPDASAALKCTDETAAASADQRYNGICRLQIDRSQRTSHGDAGGARALVWIFQP